MSDKALIGSEEACRLLDGWCFETLVGWGWTLATFLGVADDVDGVGKAVAAGGGGGGAA